MSSLLLLIACTSTSTDKKPSKNNTKGTYEKSLQAWTALKKEKGTSYEYTVPFSSFVGFGHSTRLVVKNDHVVERHYKAWNRDGKNTQTWSESTPQTLGKNKEGAATKTLDDLYQTCKNEVLTKSTLTHRVFLNVDKQGILSHCTYQPNNCMDDCSKGVRINALSFLPTSSTK